MLCVNIVFFIKNKIKGNQKRHQNDSNKIIVLQIEGFIDVYPGMINANDFPTEEGVIFI